MQAPIRNDAHAHLQCCMQILGHGDRKRTESEALEVLLLGLPLVGNTVWLLYWFGNLTEYTKRSLFPTAEIHLGQLHDAQISQST